MITISDTARISESLGVPPANKRQAREYALIHVLRTIGENGIVEVRVLTSGVVREGVCVWVATTSSTNTIEISGLIGTILDVRTKRVVIETQVVPMMIPVSKRYVSRLLKRIKLQLGVDDARWRVMHGEL